MSDIVERLTDACVGHPNAKIPWPHRLLHDAKAEIERLRVLREDYREYSKCSDRINRKNLARIAELEADNGKLRSLLETWLNHPYNIPLRTRTKAALNKEQS